jgi:fumarylpyruvate hydrolase
MHANTQDRRSVLHRNKPQLAQRRGDAVLSRVGGGSIELKVNGAVRQTSDLAKLIWSVAEAVSFLLGLVALASGDLIFTGTPEGVAAVQRGDLLEGMVEDVGTVRTRIV